MIEGRYILTHPLWFFFKPRLELVNRRKGNRICGSLHMFGFEKKLHLIKKYENELIFKIPVNIITIEMVARFSGDDCLEGFFDTPLGHFEFKGKIMKELGR